MRPRPKKKISMSGVWRSNPGEAQNVPPFNKREFLKTCEEILPSIYKVILFKKGITRLIVGTGEGRKRTQPPEPRSRRVLNEPVAG
jgi:hypothetical protein